MTRAPLAALLALLAASCGAPLMKLPKLPEAPGAPAPDAVQALADATIACRSLATFRADANVSGHVAGQRVRAQLFLGLQAPESARVEALAVGQPVFILVATGDKATLLLQRDNSVLENAPPASVLEALTGVPLGPADLRQALSGCADGGGDAAGTMAGANWRIVTRSPASTETMYLRRGGENDPWRLVAIVRRDAGREWRAEYKDFVADVPRSVRFVSTDGGRFDLQLSLSALDTTPLNAGAFNVVIPQGADRITLSDLQKSGPLGGSTNER
jgi:hypothetical protein